MPSDFHALICPLPDLDSLEISKDSYVSKELRASYSDLVYRLKWRVPDQADPAVAEQANPAAAVDLEDAAATLALHVYIVFEHKSHPDDWVLASSPAAAPSTAAHAPAPDTAPKPAAAGAAMLCAT